MGGSFGLKAQNLAEGLIVINPRQKPARKLCADFKPVSYILEQP